MNSPVQATSLEERALALLGAGVPAEACAATLGVTASRISQLLSEDDFALRLSALRYDSLAKHNARDSEYDTLEDQLIRQLKSTVPMLMDPLKVTRVLQVVNAAKRRGASSPDAILQKQEVVKLTVPIQIVNQYSTNANKQVVTVDGESMITMQSGRMTKLLAEKKDVLENQPINVEQWESGETKYDRFGFEK